MYNYSMTICSFYIHKKNSLKGTDILSLRGNFNIDIKDKNGKTESISINAMDIVNQFLNGFKFDKPDDISKKTFYISTEEKYIEEFDGYTRVDFYVNSGYFGVNSILRDVFTGKIEHIRGKNEADEKKYNVTLVIPKNKLKQDIYKGIFIFQNYGVYGVKQITVNNFDQFMKDKFNLKITCNNVAPELFIRKIITYDNIVEMVMIKNQKSLDSIDNVEFGYGTEIRKFTNLRFSDSKWSKLSDKIRYYAKGKANLFEFEDIEYDKFKVVVDFNGRNRTIDLHNVDNLSIIEGIPEDVLTFEGDLDIKKYNLFTNSIIEEYLKELVDKKG